MRITHLCLMGPVTDGWNYQENLLTKYHKKLGLEVTIITSKWIWGDNGKLRMTDQTDYINSDGIRTIRLRMRGKENFNKKFKTFKKLYSTIEETNPDILFVHDVANMNNSVITKYLKKHQNVIAFADNHADFTNSGTNWLSKNVLHKIIWRHCAKKLNPYVKKFYGVLPVRVDFLIDVYGLPKEKCELLVMGADDELVKKADNPLQIKQLREKYGINETDFLIVTGGKIDKFKYQTVQLMEAVRNIRSEKIKLIVFGSVSKELKKQVEGLCDGKTIQCIGWIDAKDSYKFFAMAQLVVFPGRHSVFWEQVAAQGIPMVVKDLPGTHHIDLGGNVLFLRKDSVGEIKKCIESIVNDKNLYKKMSDIAREKGMDKFSYANIAKRSLSLSIQNDDGF